MFAKAVKNIRIHHATFVRATCPDEVLANPTLRNREEVSTDRTNPSPPQRLPVTSTNADDFVGPALPPLGPGLRRPTQAATTKSYAHAPPTTLNRSPSATAAWRRRSCHSSSNDCRLQRHARLPLAAVQNRDMRLAEARRRRLCRKPTSRVTINPVRLLAYHVNKPSKMTGAV